MTGWAICRCVKPGITASACASAWSISARLQLAHRGVEAVDRAAHPQPEIGRDLVVARARRVQPPGRRADQLGEPRLDVEVDVLVRLAEDEGAGFDLGPDLR